MPDYSIPVCLWVPSHWSPEDVLKFSEIFKPTHKAKAEELRLGLSSYEPPKLVSAFCAGNDEIVGWRIPVDVSESMQAYIVYQHLNPRIEESSDRPSTQPITS